jgi:hypothetical protein|tara:strand:+ start:141 stop:296 length:156 start_codon:yes stop_codon:yes gene_type:complete
MRKKEDIERELAILLKTYKILCDTIQEKEEIILAYQDLLYDDNRRREVSFH